MNPRKLSDLLDEWRGIRKDLQTLLVLPPQTPLRDLRPQIREIDSAAAHAIAALQATDAAWKEETESVFALIPESERNPILYASGLDGLRSILSSLRPEKYHILRSDGGAPSTSWGTAEVTDDGWEVEVEAEDGLRMIPGAIIV
jgi:hypothetical protein